MKNVRGLFFDLDGTLVNTYEADFFAYRDAIRQVTGIIIDRDNFMSTNGMEMRDKLKRLTPHINLDQVILIAAKKKEYYPQYLHTTVPNSPLIALLEELSGQHVTALVTTAKRQNAEAVLDAHSIAGLFNITVYGDDVDEPKPHPASYLRALELADLEADEVLAFEDSKTGIDAAHAAGIRTIQIRRFV